MARGRGLPSHLLVMRLSAMGDVAMLPHALGALRAAYPDLKISVVSNPALEPFFDGLDVEFIPVDVKKEWRGASGLRALARMLRARGIDAFADVHRVWRTGFVEWLMRLHGIRTAHISKERLRKRLATGWCRSSREYLKHSVIRYCDTFRKLGFEFDDPKPPVKRLRPDPLPDYSGVRVGFAPFSAHRGKTCPDSLRRRITELLSRRFDRVFIHSGGGVEADFAREMERTYPNVTAVYGRLGGGLRGEMDLVSNEDCMISMDSLAMHLASLTATPVVSIWGATHPKIGFMGYGSAPENAVQADMSCRPCSTYGKKPCKYGDYRCLYAISAEEVVERVAGIVEGKQHPTSRRTGGE